MTKEMQTNGAMTLTYQDDYNHKSHLLMDKPTSQQPRAANPTLTQIPSDSTLPVNNCGRSRDYEHSVTKMMLINSSSNVSMSTERQLQAIRNRCWGRVGGGGGGGTDEEQEAVAGGGEEGKRDHAYWI